MRNLWLHSHMRGQLSLECILGEGNTSGVSHVGGLLKLNSNNGSQTSFAMRIEVGFFPHSFSVLMVTADQTENKGFIMFPYMNTKAQSHESMSCWRPQQRLKRLKIPL